MEPASEPRGRVHRAVPAHGELPGEPGRRRGPGNRGVHDEDAREALRMLQAGKQRRVPAPVVAGELDPFELEGVEQRHGVGGERLGVVAAAGRLGPAEPAQIGHEQAPVRGQQGHLPTPLVPVLRPAVEEEHRRALAGLRKVHAQRPVGGADVDEPVLDTVDVRETGRHLRHHAAPCASTSSTHRRTRRRTTAPCARRSPARAPDVTLVTSRFAYGDVPPAEGYAVRRALLPARTGAAGLAACAPRRRLAQHVPDMLRYRRAAREADVVHFQWLTVQPLDVRLLPRDRPLVITAHDVLPREPRAGPAARAAAPLRPRRRGRRALPPRPRAARRRPRGSARARPRHPARRVRLPRRSCPRRSRCRPSCAERRRGRSSSSSACCAPTRASTSCSRRGAGSAAPSCGSSACRGWTSRPCAARATPSVRFVPRFVPEAQVAGLVPPRRPRRAALPRDRPVRRAVHRAGVRQAAAAHERRRLPRGGRARRRRAGRARRSAGAAHRAAAPARRPGPRASALAAAAREAAATHLLVGRDRRAPPRALRVAFVRDNPRP